LLPLKTSSSLIILFPLITKGFQTTYLVRRLQELSYSLKEFLEEEIQRGISADYSKAFIINQRTIQEKNLEREICEPVITGHNIFRFGIEFFNEYIFYFRSIKLTIMKQVTPILEEILNNLKPQTNIYNTFELISEKTSDKIICDLETKDTQQIKAGELKKAYQTLFNQIRWRFRDDDEHDAFESSKKLGFKMVTLWRDLLKFGVSEDMFSSLEVLLTLRDFSDI